MSRRSGYLETCKKSSANPAAATEVSEPASHLEKGGQDGGTNQPTNQYNITRIHISKVEDLKGSKKTGFKSQWERTWMAMVRSSRKGRRKGMEEKTTQDVSKR